MSEHRNGHQFDPKNWQRLESQERREKINPSVLADAMGLEGGEVILDLGCGTGYFAEVFAPRCGKLIGVDISDEMLNVFRGKESFKKLTNVELKVGKADDIPIDDDSCDLVVHVNLLHEIKDVEKFHNEIKRVLKPGGRIFVVDWQAWDTGMGPPVDHRVPEEKALEWIERDGFTELKEHPLYKDFYVIEARA